MEPGQGSDLRAKASSACDACKRRKLKCSSTQPCSRCVATGVTCTYGSSASRSTALEYTRQLESKVAELQKLLHQQPAVGPEDQSSVSCSQSRARTSLIESIVGPEDDHIYLSAAHTGVDSFHGRFAGLSILRTVRDLCNQSAGSEGSQGGRALAEAFDSTLLQASTQYRTVSITLLPAREMLQSTLDVALDEAMSAQECLDRSEFQDQVERLYTRDPEDYTTDDYRALSLVYALVALGRQRMADDGAVSLDSGVFVLKGNAYFKASRAILDATDCNHLDSIRAIICIVNYLLSASMASRAHTFVCLGVAAALRIGLHVYSTSIKEQFSARELTQRRRVFAVLNFTQTYTASVLGMPLLLKDPDPRQVIAVPEEELYDQGQNFILTNPLSPVSATILACKLFQVSASVTKSYESDPVIEQDSNSYHLHYDKIGTWVHQLQEWNANLPHISPGTMSRNVLRAQLILRFIDATTRIAIHRPFLQHILRSKEDSDFDQRGFECGSACLQASMQAIWLANTMDVNDILHHTQWYVIYNMALAASSLMLFELGPGLDPAMDEIRAAAKKARELLDKTGTKSLSALLCSKSLNALQEQIEKSHAAAPQSPRSYFMQAIGATGAEIPRSFS